MHKLLIYDFGIFPIIWGIPITEIENFRAKHTDYELSVWLNAELDKFAIQTYIDLKINHLRFAEWYALQKIFTLPMLCVQENI